MAAIGQSGYSGPTKTAHPPPTSTRNFHHGRILAASPALRPAYPFAVRPYALHGPVRISAR